MSIRLDVAFETWLEQRSIERTAEKVEKRLGSQIEALDRDERLTYHKRKESFLNAEADAYRRKTVYKSEDPRR